MREYELTLIILPDMDKEAFNEIIERVKGWISDSGGEITKTDLWGKRSLAYPIRKLTEGQYVLLHVKMAAEYGAELERNLRFVEPIMRYLLIAKE